MAKTWCAFPVVLVLGFFVLQARSQEVTESCACVNQSIDGLDAFLQRRRDILNTMHELAFGSEPSCLGKTFINEINLLLDSPPGKVADFAEMVTILLGGINGFLFRNPTFCAEANIINASISCILYNDSQPMVNEIENGIINAFYERITKLRYYDANINLEKCQLPADLNENNQVPDWECEGEGLVYDLDLIWSLKGDGIPRKIKALVQLLYDSDKYEDRATAAIAVYSLLDFTHRSKNFYRPWTLFEYFALEYDRNIDRCCCEERQSRLRYLRDQVLVDKDSAMQNLAAFYSSSVACQDGNY